MTVEESIKPNNIKFCECGCGEQVKRRFREGHNIRGSGNPCWKGGISHSGDYIRILKPDHPHKDVENYVKEHRLIYEEFYKCCLLKWVDIHHINGNKRDNEISNLQPLSHSQHLSITKTKNMINRICYLCDSKETYSKKQGYAQWRRFKDKLICKRCNDRLYHLNKKILNRLLKHAYNISLL